MWEAERAIISYISGAQRAQGLLRSPLALEVIAFLELPDHAGCVCGLQRRSLSSFLLGSPARGIAWSAADEG